MSDLILEPTTAALWQRLVRESAHESGSVLGEELEAYLMMLLHRFLGRPEMVQAIMGRDYLRAQAFDKTLRAEHLRDVGDQCLLYAGLFPGMAHKRRVSINYFVDLGRTAYLDLAGALTHGAGQLFLSLAEAFVTLMDTLSSLRSRPAFSDLYALDQFDLWHKSGSRAARRALAEHTQAMPVPVLSQQIH